MINRYVPNEQEHPYDEPDEELLLLGIKDLQQPLLMLGGYCTVGLIIYLGELLISPDSFYIKNYKLAFCGLIGCLYVTFLNLSIYAIQNLGSDLEINWETAEERKDSAFAILGFGIGTSYFFIVGCLVKYLGEEQLFEFI